MQLPTRTLLSLLYSLARQTQPVSLALDFGDGHGIATSSLIPAMGSAVGGMFAMGPVWQARDNDELTLFEFF